MPLMSQNKMPSANTSKKECCSGGECCGRCHLCGCGDFVKKLMVTLLGVLLVYLIFFVGSLVRNNVKKYEYIGKADKMESTILVNGVGRVSGNNDIAMTTIGYSNLDKDVSKAQVDNKKVMDAIMADLKKMGVEDKDLQTNYTIYPEYEYSTDKGSVLKGYRVSNQLTIKIRNLGKVTDILGLAGKYGATEISGLTFTVDDPENLKAQARNKAVTDAKIKAAYLAQSLGARLGRVVSYSEYENTPYDYPMVLSKVNFLGAEGGGGGAPEAVATGSKDVVMSVSVTYEILP
jgi:uncharacterized protein YggE